jgi:hypothetical protein
MAWKPGPNAPLGIPNGSPAIADTVPTVPVGALQYFVEDTQGPCELIYGPGVAGLVAGDLVVFDWTPGAIAVTRHVKDTFANTGRMVGVAVSAPQAGQYGWYIIQGTAIVNAVAGTVAGVVMGTATTGQVGNTADAGDQILNARIYTAQGVPAAGKVYMHLNRSCIQGQIT